MVSRVASSYLALGSYTVYRRKTGEPVKASIIPLSGASVESVQRWRHYNGITNYYENLKRDRFAPKGIPEISSVPYRNSAHYGLALVEADKDLLHGFCFGSVSPTMNLGSRLYSAPWNYYRYNGDAGSRFFQASNFVWNQTPEDDCLAVSGVGWSLISYVAASFLNQDSNRAFPIILSGILEATDAWRYYQDVIGLDLRMERDNGLINVMQAESLVKRALLGEQSQTMGWIIDRSK